MPLYEYECTVCHHRFEKIEKFSAPDKQPCPVCGKQADRVIAPAAIQFKGSGWYVTDYGRGSASSSAVAGKTEKSSESPSSDKASPAPSGNGSSSSKKD